MSQQLEVRVPAIGDFDGVEVIEVLVKPGDSIVAEGSLVTLESDKASMEIPSPTAGTVHAIHVKVGDTVSEGTLVATLDADVADVAEDDAASKAPVADRHDLGPATTAPRQEQPAAEAPLPAADVQTDVLVLGAGPGGYTAAFRAADLGLRVVMVDSRPQLGGVCLNVGCIPSKAMLHAAAIIDEVAEFADRGIDFGKPRIDLEALDRWKSGVVDRLAKGLAGLAKQRGVEVIEGTGTLAGEHLLTVEDASTTRSVAFRHAILATGSRPVMIPGVPSDDERIWSSDDAIRFNQVPKRLLVIGGGIIGLEMAQVYSSLGAGVTVVELLDGIMPGADRDLVRPLERRLRKRYENIFVGTKVSEITALKKGLEVAMEGPKAPESDTFDAVLVAVGRRPNSDRIGSEAAGVALTERGFVAVDAQRRTSVPHIFAIGDLVGQPMLAHKATHEGKVAAEVIAGHDSAFDARVIPSVAYTDPEVAWVGITEEEAVRQGVAYEKGSIPWTASGRALGIGRSDGLTKALFDSGSGRLIGVGIVGPHAGDLISEAALAIEMGAQAGDIGLTIHPHPTLSETLAFAAEAVDGTLTDLYLPKAK